MYRSGTSEDRGGSGSLLLGIPIAVAASAGCFEAREARESALSSFEPRRIPGRIPRKAHGAASLPNFCREASWHQ